MYYQNYQDAIDLVLGLDVPDRHIARNLTERIRLRAGLTHEEVSLPD